MRRDEVRRGARRDIEISMPFSVESNLLMGSLAPYIYSKVESRDKNKKKIFIRKSGDNPTVYWRFERVFVSSKRLRLLSQTK